MSTSFTFIDDAITIPYRGLDSSDSITLSESVNPLISAPTVDSITLTEILSLFADLDIYDSAALEDQLKLITFEQVDSANFSDLTGSIILSGLNEHLNLGEFVSAALGVSDSGNLVETPEIGLLVEDPISVLDSINKITLAQTDAIQATEFLLAISTFVDAFDLDNSFVQFSQFITADSPGTDHLHWNDEFDYQFIQTTLATEDDSVVVELTANIEIPVIDSANVSEFIELFLAGTDSFSGTDHLTSLNVSASSQDEFIYEEFFELVKNINSADDPATLSETKQLNVNASGVQNITLEEQVSIVVYVADSGNLVENVNSAYTETKKEETNEIPLPSFIL
jgi:hypothetical protein